VRRKSTFRQGKGVSLPKREELREPQESEPARERDAAQKQHQLKWMCTEAEGAVTGHAVGRTYGFPQEKLRLGIHTMS